MRRARRIDTTHRPIRDRLRQRYGEQAVIDTHELGESFPDLVVGVAGRTFLVECKTVRPTRGPDRGGSHGESDGQRKLREAWRGDAWLVVTSPEQAVEAVELALGALGALGPLVERSWKLPRDWV